MALTRTETIPGFGEVTVYAIIDGWSVQRDTGEVVVGLSKYRSGEARQAHKDAISELESAHAQEQEITDALYEDDGSDESPHIVAKRQIESANRKSERERLNLAIMGNSAFGRMDVVIKGGDIDLLEVTVSGLYKWLSANALRDWNDA